MSINSMGVYSAMRARAIEAQGFLPYHLLHLFELNWIDLTDPLSENYSGYIRDVRSGGSVFRIPLPDIETDRSESIVEIYKQFFLVSYHAVDPTSDSIDAWPNSADNPIYPSRGLAVWHVVGKTDADNIGNPRVCDLEVATGLYEGGSIVSGSWVPIGDPDPESGYDSLDFFPNRIEEEYIHYPGDAHDFFDETSYPIFGCIGRSDLNTNSYSTIVENNLRSIDRTCPQDVPNSIVIAIPEMGLGQDGLDARVHLLLAPYENLADPETPLEVDQQYHITWDADPEIGDYSSILTTVELSYSIDGGVHFSPIEEVSASVGGYYWTPSIEDGSSNGVLRGRFYNSRSSNYSDDITESFAVVSDYYVPYEFIEFPNEHEVFFPDDEITIEWTYEHEQSEHYVYAELFLILNDQVSGTVIQLDDPGVQGDVLPSDQNFVWTVEQDQIADRAWIKLVCYSNDGGSLHNYYDFSDEYFLVRPKVEVFYEAIPAVSGALDGYSYEGKPIAFASFDYNNDGIVDLAISQEQDDGRLFEGQVDNDGSDAPDYSRISVSGLSIAPGISSIASADYDGDGIADIVTTGTTGGAFFRGREDEYHERIYETVSLTPGLQNSSQGIWGDFNRDGYPDLFVVTGGEGNPQKDILYRNGLYQGQEDFVREFREQPGPWNQNWEVTDARTALWLDIESDGDLDLFVGVLASNNSILSAIYRYDSEAFFEYQGAWPNDAEKTGICDAAVLDLEGDGDYDIAVAYAENSPIVFVNRGDGNFSGSAPIVLGGEELASGAKEIDTVDVDLDGRTDIKVIPVGGTTTRVYLNLGDLFQEGKIVFVDVTDRCGFGEGAEPLTAFFADMDRDGDADAYFGRSIATDEFYYQARQESGGDDEPTNNWIGVKADPCVMEAGNPMGAEVQIKKSGIGTFLGSVEFGTGGPRAGNESTTCVIGIGEFSGDVDIYVVFTNGYSVVGRSIPVNTYWTMPRNLVPSSIKGSYVINPATDEVTWIFEWNSLYPNFAKIY